MSYFKLITALKDVISEDERINTITEGDIDNFDEWKQNIPSMAHIFISNGTSLDNLDTFNVLVQFVDIVSENNNVTTDKFIGNDNRQDVYEEMYNVMRRVYMKFRKYFLDSEISVQENATFDKIEQFDNENRLAGWGINFIVEVPNTEIRIC